jgi:hypothetical protein
MTAVSGGYFFLLFEQDGALPRPLPSLALLIEALPRMFWTLPLGRLDFPLLAICAFL